MKSEIGISDKKMNQGIKMMMMGKDSRLVDGGEWAGKSNAGIKLLGNWKHKNQTY